MSQCVNCGSVNHKTDGCPNPSYLSKCSRCLIVSLNGGDHGLPCTRIHTEYGLKKSIMALEASSVFQIRFTNASDSLYILNGAKNSMELIEPDAFPQYLSTETDGIFTTYVDQDERVIDYDAVVFKRFSILFAFFDAGNWYFRCRGVVTSTHGFICFPVRKVFQNHRDKFFLPQEFSSNTALVIGVSSILPSTKLQVKVFANPSGELNDGNDCYIGSLEWYKETQSIKISENMTHDNAPELKFDSVLYDRIIEGKRVGNLSKHRKFNNQKFERSSAQSKVSWRRYVFLINFCQPIQTTFFYLCQVNDSTAVHSSTLGAETKGDDPNAIIDEPNNITVHSVIRV